MYKEKQLMYIKVLTPTHAGAGQCIDNIDMPIQREKHSNIPKIEASSLKGSIKNALYNKIKLRYVDTKKELKNSDEFKWLSIIFGSENGDDYASLIGFTDARLLLFPIKSATDIYKLITCPYILKRWTEDLEIVNNAQVNKIKELVVDDGECIAMDKSKCFNQGNESKIILEEYVFDVCQNKAEELNGVLKAINGIDVSRVVILSDSDFIDLVCMYTEIITRNKIDVNTGVAEGTGLFTEEYLPVETVLYFMVLASPSFNGDDKKLLPDPIEYFNKNVNEVFQVGGNATIGKGIVKWLNKEAIKNGES